MVGMFSMCQLKIEASIFMSIFNYRLVVKKSQKNPTTR